MSRLLYPRHRFAEKASLELDDLLQQLVELTGNDPDPEQEAQRAPLVIIKFRILFLPDDNINRAVF